MWNYVAVPWIIVFLLALFWSYWDKLKHEKISGNPSSGSDVSALAQVWVLAENHFFHIFVPHFLPSFPFFLSPLSPTLPSDVFLSRPFYFFALSSFFSPFFPLLCLKTV
jgi:hypothetical protein